MGSRARGLDPLLPWAGPHLRHCSALSCPALYRHGNPPQVLLISGLASIPDYSGTPIPGIITGRPLDTHTATGTYYQLPPTSTHKGTVGATFNPTIATRVITQQSTLSPPIVTVPSVVPKPTLSPTALLGTGQPSVVSRIPMSTARVPAKRRPLELDLRPLKLPPGYIRSLQSCQNPR